MQNSNNKGGHSKKTVYMRLMSMMALCAIVFLAACGGDAATATPSTAAPTAASSDTNNPTDSQLPADSGSAVTIDATLREWAIDLSQAEVAAGSVTFNVSNTGSMAHNLTVQDSTGKNVGATPNFRGSEGAQTLTVTLAAGTYTLICSLPGHAQRGQTIQLTVK